MPGPGTKTTNTAPDQSMGTPPPNLGRVEGYQALALRRKESPGNLREELNTTSDTAGATILIIGNEPGATKGVLKHITNKFYLSNMQMPYQEKAQVLETFGASAVSFFGQSATVYTFSGLVLEWPNDSANPASTMHGSSLIQLYNNHLRGSKLVKEGNIAVLRVLNHMIYGYPLAFNLGYSTEPDKTQSFSLSFVVTDHMLASPGMFTEKDLAKNYTINAEKLTAEQTYIQEFLILLNSKEFRLTYTINEFGVNTEPPFHIFNLTRNSIKFSEFLDKNLNEVYKNLITSFQDLADRFTGSPILAEKLPKSWLEEARNIIPTENTQKTIGILARLATITTQLQNLFLRTQ